MSYSVTGVPKRFRTEKQARAEAYRRINDRELSYCRVYRNITEKDGIQVGVAFNKVKSDALFVISDDYYVAWMTGPYATMPFRSRDHPTYVLKKDGSLGKRI